MQKLSPKQQFFVLWLIGQALNLASVAQYKTMVLGRHQPPALIITNSTANPANALHRPESSFSIPSLKSHRSQIQELWSRSDNKTAALLKPPEHSESLSCAERGWNCVSAEQISHRLQIQMCVVGGNNYSISIHPAVMSQRMPAKTAERISRIRDLLGRAICEVHSAIRYSRSGSRSPVKGRSEQSSQCQTVSEVLANLQKGYLMVKHSQKIPEPHDKFVYLSADCRYICWKSLDKHDEKRIELSSIERVIKDGAEFYIRSTSVRDISSCLVVIAAQRRLQLEANTPLEAEYFHYELLRVLKHWKAMSLNYKYNKQ